MDNGKTAAHAPHDAMAFFDGSDLLAPAGLALAFAGDGGRIATLPDLVDARLAAPSDDVTWDRIMTTRTAEFLGLSRGGIPLIAVAHGVGPLAETDGAFRAYVTDRDGDGRGRISHEEFLRLIDGHYGDVDVVPLQSLWRLRRFPMGEMLTYAQACECPLTRARLGPLADAFLARHRGLSVAWLREKGHAVRDNACVISLQDTAKCGYGGLPLDDRWAYAHLIDMSPLTDYGHGHWDGPRWHRSLVTELSCHAWGTRTGIVGIRGSAATARVHPGPDLARTAFRHVWRTLARRVDAAYPAGRVHALTAVDGLWFTRHDGTGCGPSDGDPAHPVRRLEGAGDGANFRMPIPDGDHRKVRLDERLIRREAPPWANAYRILENPRAVWEGDRATHHLVKVEYCVAELDLDWRIPPRQDLERQFDLLLSLA